MTMEKVLVNATGITDKHCQKKKVTPAMCIETHISNG